MNVFLCRQSLMRLITCNFNLQTVTFTFPIETYAILEKQLGQEAALNLARSVEQVANTFAEEAQSIAQQKKIEIRDEMSKELASRADVALVRTELQGLDNKLQGKIDTLEARFLGEIKAVEARLDRKLTIYMIVILCAIFITNQDTVSFLLRVLGVVK
jgi:hypothetical protein